MTNTKQPANEAPPCAPPDVNPRRPRLVLPSGACDCHAHIFGPRSRYPLTPDRLYTPPDCLLSAYVHMLETLGVGRAVLVQPSAYGTDNALLLDALEEAGPRLRGVAVVDPQIGERPLRALHEAGVRGVRVNVVDVKDRKPGTLPLDALRPLAQRIAPLGWHLELLLHVDEFPDLDRVLGDFPVDTVYGHLGYMRTDKGLGAPGFQALLRLMKAGRAWVKLSGPSRISTEPYPHRDAVELARALVAAAPRRVLWGSDWPHVMVKGAMPNDGDLADLLTDWIPDPATRTQVLVDNPARLYGFDR